MSKIFIKKIIIFLFFLPLILVAQEVEIQPLSKEINTKCIEIHTGKISNLIKNNKKYIKELKKIKLCVKYAKSLGLEVHAGHGMDYKTAKILSKVREIEEFNIGHFIIGESIIFGLKTTIGRFKKILK